jgi:hypothetical protein
MKWRRPMCTLLLVTALTVTASCDSNSEAKQPKTLHVSPPQYAVDLHRNLIRYAQQGDIVRFQALLTPKSIELLNGFFEATRVADRSGERAIGWSEFLEEHAKLPPQAADSAPYPIAGQGKDARIALDAHPNSSFFRDMIQEASSRAATTKSRPGITK